jgi:hypothetical protein
LFIDLQPTKLYQMLHSSVDGADAVLGDDVVSLGVILLGDVLHSEYPAHLDELTIVQNF